MKASRIGVIAAVVLLCLSGVAVSGAAASPAATGTVTDSAVSPLAVDIPFGDGASDSGNSTDSESSNESADSDDSGDSGNSSDAAGPSITESIDAASGGDSGDSGTEGNESSGNASDPLSTEVEDDGGFGPSPKSWILNGLSGVADRALSEMASAINVLQGIIVDLPAPGDLSDLGSVVNPQNGWWPAVYLLMGAMYVFGVMSLIVQTAKAFTISSPKKKRDTLKRLGVSWFMTLGGVALAPLGLHLIGDIALRIVPDGQMFTSSFGNFAQLGFGIILGGMLVGLASTVVAMGIVALFLVFVIAHLVVGFWPIVWPAWAANGQARQYGAMGLYLYGAVCGINFMQASMLLLMYHINWSASPGGEIGGFIGLTAGLLFTLVYFPWNVLKQTHLAASMTVGVGAALSAGSLGKTAAKETREAPQKLQNFREKHFGGPDHRRTGEVGNAREGSVAKSGSTPTGTSAGSQSSGSGSSGGYQAQRGVDAGSAESDSSHERDRINRGYY